MDTYITMLVFCKKIGDGTEENPYRPEIYDEKDGPEYGWIEVGDGYVVKLDKDLTDRSKYTEIKEKNIEALRVELKLEKRVAKAGEVINEKSLLKEFLVDTKSVLKNKKKIKALHI